MLYGDRYAELHTIEWDFINSACGDCPYGQKDNCQYYYNKCPQEVKE